VNFSVAICVYCKDNAKYFDDALQSLIEQSLLPNEIILVVDGPIEKNLQDIIKKFKTDCENYDTEFNVIYLEQNKGHGEARRISIENAKYNLIALMDADDLSRYDRFEKQIDIFTNNDELSVVGGQIMEISHESKKNIGMRVVPIENQKIKEYLKKRCPFNQMTVMFKKCDVLEAGNYVDFYHNEDYYLWVRMYLKDFKFYNLGDILVDVRVNEKFYDRRGGWKYFVSEFKLQKIMYKSNIISWMRFVFNALVRFALQVLLTNYVRGFIFKKLFRKVS
jgi:glycosyltransferase involved in cell wall biosynthesis